MLNRAVFENNPFKVINTELTDILYNKALHVLASIRCFLSQYVQYATL